MKQISPSTSNISQRLKKNKPNLVIIPEGDQQIINNIDQRVRNNEITARQAIDICMGREQSNYNFASSTIALCREIFRTERFRENPILNLFTNKESRDKSTNKWNEFFITMTLNKIEKKKQDHFSQQHISKRINRCEHRIPIFRKIKRITTEKIRQINSEILNMQDPKEIKAKLESINIFDIYTNYNLEEIQAFLKPLVLTQAIEILTNTNQELTLEDLVNVFNIMDQNQQVEFWKAVQEKKITLTEKQLLHLATHGKIKSNLTSIKILEIISQSEPESESESEPKFEFKFESKYYQPIFHIILEEAKKKNDSDKQRLLKLLKKTILQKVNKERPMCTHF